MPGQPVTLRDIARAASVDVSTVSLALRGHPRIPAATRQRIRQVAGQLGYSPDPSLSRLAARRWLGRRSSETATLAYLAQIHHPAEDPALRDRYLQGVREQAGRLGYQVDVFSPSEYPDDRRLSDVIHARGIRGVILAQRTSLDREHRLAWQRFCIVQAGFNLSIEALTLVRCDLEASMVQGYARLIAAGYRRILVYLVIEPKSASDRIFVEALQHLPAPPPGCKRKAMVEDWGAFRDGLPTLLARIRAWRPDVVLVAQAGILKAWRNMGLKVPEEFAVACLNLEPGLYDLAGMNLQMEQVGATAVDLVDVKLRRFEYGVPAARLTVMVEPVWVSGSSLPEPAARPAKKRKRQLS